MRIEGCPRCDNTAALDQGSKKMKYWRWRRLECTRCGHRWSTVELPAESLPLLKLGIQAAELGGSVENLSDLLLPKDQRSDSTCPTRGGHDSIPPRKPLKPYKDTVSCSPQHTTSSGRVAW